MPAYNNIAIWKEIPFLRIILPFIAGIILQDACCFTFNQCCLSFLITAVTTFFLAVLPLKKRFHFRIWQGVCLQAAMLSCGLCVTCLHQAPQQKQWIGHYTHQNPIFSVEISTPAVEKANSYKVVASAKMIFYDSLQKEVQGDLLLYFEKDSLPFVYQPGDLIYFSKKLQYIKGTGNPGSFDFGRYAALQQCYFQVYLPRGSYSHVPAKQPGKWKQLLYSSRSKLVAILKKYIPSDREAGLAEALLIAYKEDLDKSLVQSYANTGVVHIIAISGLHLGLIYWLLGLLFRPFTTIKGMKWVKPVGIICGLWAFSLLAGASPSVLRSAVMFSCMVVGDLFGKRTHSINTLLASAFLLLCFNPFWLWDVGFQLSYAAVLSLLVFMKPVYNLIYCKNRWLDLIWKMNAVTIAAQLLTLPLCIYYFHQFPNTFLLTNLIAVPLSSLILLLEILLCMIAGIPSLAVVTGQLVQWLLYGMNGYIETISRLPYAVWEHLNISLSQMAFLYGFIICLSYWLFHKKVYSLFSGLVFLCLFSLDRMIVLLRAQKQQLLVVYNIPRLQAIDFFFGTSYIFRGDSLAKSTTSPVESTLSSCRLQFHALTAYPETTSINSSDYFKIGRNSILFFQQGTTVQPGKKRIEADIVIISHDPRQNLSDLLKAVDCRQLVLDASNTTKTVGRWRREANSLGIAFHSVVDNGAFVIHLP